MTLKPYRALSLTVVAFNRLQLACEGGLLHSPCCNTPFPVAIRQQWLARARLQPWP
ncbi:MAG: hypothetical protein F2732_03895 [Actinobacteria bacterium]|nr:hypothetical protein [Actinomycetota bacterium]